MLDPFAIFTKYFGRILFVSFKMIHQRFLADGTWDGFLSISPNEENSLLIPSISPFGIWKFQCALIHDAKDPQDAHGA